MNHHPVATYRYIPGPLDMVAPLVTAPVRATARATTSGATVLGVAMIIMLIVATIVALVTMALIGLTAYVLWCAVRALHCHMRARRAMMVPTAPHLEET